MRPGYNLAMTTATAPNLALEPPRSPLEELDGITVVPRAIDKARAYIAGTLGEYIYCECGLNARLFEMLGTTEDDFLEAVRTAPDDAAVASWLQERVRPDPTRIAEFNEAIKNDPQIRELDTEEGR